MDEDLFNILAKLSLSCSEDDQYCKNVNPQYQSSNYTSSSNVSSPSYEQLANNLPEEDLELKSAVSSLFQELNGTNRDGYDKTKLMVALLGNIDLVTSAVKNINRLVTMGKRMEQIYREYYVNPSAQLDLDEISSLVSEFNNLYSSESYVREVNVSRVYLAYCNKLAQIYSNRIQASSNNEDDMIM